MTFLSYARNFEDVLLFRAFGGLDSGFYVDIDAGEPDGDSVTRAFYDRGWRGINVAATAENVRRLSDARPRDINLLADPARGLSALLERYAPHDIHFLRVGVDGADRVLLEIDLTRFRPRILLVAASGQAPSNTEWQGDAVLGEHRYRHAWFDGLSHFFLAQEQAYSLSSHFQTPPGMLDDFVREDGTTWGRIAELRQREELLGTRLARAEARTQASANRLLDAAARMATLRRDANRREAYLERLEAETSRLHDAVRSETAHALAWRQRAEAAEAAGFGAGVTDERLRTELLAMKRGADEARRDLEAIRSSTSWRITSPMRAGMRLFRRPGSGRAPASPAPRIAGAASPEEPSDRGPASDLTDAPVAGTAATRPAPGDRTVAGRAAAPLRTVHQFHSGAAVGDAITNAMLLTRRVLREAGFRSEIFAENPPAELADDIRSIDELPEHADYALILRHSMGHDALERVLALPAPKVLLYHNITPPQFITGHPVLQRYAELGREQLALLPGHVAAALADSDYNAWELRRLGFGAVDTCALLFDLNVLRAGAARHARHGDAFTVLFVGRVARNKNQSDLLLAFSHFRRSFERQSRLVLVGRLDDGSGYAAELRDLVDREGLRDCVTFTDLVDDEDILQRYAEADLYVSLSRHEGFGVPLVEAMARGVPVLARSSGAVPYTLGDASGLLDDDAPEAVAIRMLTLARDPAALDALASRQATALDRFQLDVQTPALLRALALAGAAPPTASNARSSAAAHLRITVAGHASGSYSLASVNRSLARTLDRRLPGRVRLVPLEGHAPAPLCDVPEAARAEAVRLAARPVFETGPEVVISNHYPLHVPTPPGDLPLALFYWEESLVPAATVEVLNHGFRGVLAPSRFVAKVLRDSGTAVAVRVVGQAPDLSAFRAIAAFRREQPRRAGPVTLLHVSSCFPRKGVDVLLAAYARAFRAGDAVQLVIKGFPNPHNDVAEQIAALQVRDANVAPIELIDRDLDEAALTALYADADVMVLPTRGEGYNMPAAEAMAAGLPLLVTGAGGHMDFCDDGNARLLRWRYAPSGTHLATPHSLWIEPDEDDLVAALADAAAACRDEGDGGRALRERASRAEAAIAVAAAPEAMAERVEEVALELLVAPPPVRARVAWVTSWNVRCGVAEYSHHLLSATAAADASLRHAVLADRRTVVDEAVEPLDGSPEGCLDDPHGGSRACGPDDPSLRVAWALGHRGAAAGLQRAISLEDPAVVVVQHQPGLMRFDTLARLLSAPALTDRAVVVTLHNTHHILDVEAAERDAALTALRGVARVVVHTLIDLERLRELGAATNAVLIPQGAPRPSPPAPVRQLIPGLGSAPEAGGEPVIGCYGFFLPDKGIPQLIEAVSLLRRSWPGLRLRLVNARYDDPASDREIALCRTLASSSGLDGAVEWHTDFLPEASSRALLRGCDVVAVPTQVSKEGSSASLRTALAAGAPVATTPIPFFGEAASAVFRFADTDAGAIADGLDGLLRDPEARRAVRDAGQAWLSSLAWDAIGQRFAGLLRGLANDAA